MEKIAVLGPEGTFSDVAVKKYMDVYDLPMEPVYHPTIEEAFHAIGQECRYGVIPIENTLDGYVQRTLDLMLEMDVSVVDEIIIPVQFALVANVSDLSELRKLHVQFKASGQCRNFINSLHGVEISITESNMESYHKARVGVDGEGAIVPIYVDTSDFTYFEKNVTDMDGNYTRFIVVKADDKDGSPRLVRPAREGNMKIPIFVSPLVDRPGMLFDILRTFNERRINLVAIMSRPTKKIMGTYHFYMEIDAYTGDFDTIMEAAKLIDLKYNLKIMGAYLM
ncbi:MAG: ACT domain-containing protein [Firmicutes bacterium]|nr:ACT domain-containing protein [Bacillota bacterium]